MKVARAKLGCCKMFRVMSESGLSALRWVSLLAMPFGSWKVVPVPEGVAD